MDSIAGARTRLPDMSDLRLGLGAWAAFILATLAYCLCYQAFVAAVTPAVGRSLATALREWGAWAPLAPWALRQLRAPLPWRDALLRCIFFALLAACLPIFADQWSGDRAAASSLALFWPRNIALALALLLVARVTQGHTPVPAPAAEKPNQLLVSKGADQCLIRIDDIQHLSASGNYVDICAANQRYLLRSTIGDLEALLPKDHFVRTHRSHIVRVGEIERIRIERSGSGTVFLRGGATVAISRGYRAHLRARQAVLNSRLH